MKNPRTQAKESRRGLTGTPPPANRRNLSDTVSDDPVVSRAKERIGALLMKQDTKRLLDEISTMHGSRMVRGLTTDGVVANQGKRLIDATLQNTAYRARLIEIKMSLLRTSSRVGELLDSVIGYARTEYHDRLAALGRTQADRNAALNQLFSSQYERLRRIEDVIQAADLVIEDLDQCGWALKRVIDVVTLMHQTKH